MRRMRGREEIEVRFLRNFGEKCEIYFGNLLDFAPPPLCADFLDFRVRGIRFVKEMCIYFRRNLEDFANKSY